MHVLGVCAGVCVVAGGVGVCVLVVAGGAGGVCAYWPWF